MNIIKLYIILNKDNLLEDFIKFIENKKDAII